MKEIKIFRFFLNLSGELIVRLTSNFKFISICNNPEGIIYAYFECNNPTENSIITHDSLVDHKFYCVETEDMITIEDSYQFITSIIYEDRVIHIYKNITENT